MKLLICLWKRNNPGKVELANNQTIKKPSTLNTLSAGGAWRSEVSSKTAQVSLRWIQVCLYWPQVGLRSSPAGSKSFPRQRCSAWEEIQCLLGTKQAKAYIKPVETQQIALTSWPRLSPSLSKLIPNCAPKLPWQTAFSFMPWITAGWIFGTFQIRNFWNARIRHGRKKMFLNS